jgi:hypothetical protein
MASPTTAESTVAYQRVHPYDRWLESLGVPVFHGYYIEDLRTLKLGYWDRRGCDVAFLQLAGQEGVSGASLIEIPPGQTLPPFRIAIDDLAYVVQGRGLTTIWAGDKPKVTFEWQKHSMFLAPANYTYQLTNTQGNQPVRILFTNGLPTAMTAIPDARFYFDSSVVDLDVLYGSELDFYSEAKVARETSGRMRHIWMGNFFPDMLLWDKLEPFRGRGAGGHVVWITFPKSLHGSHMSVFDAGTYKKGHRHGPGVVIVIPAGEGFSVMWPNQDAEKVVIPWHEGSVFVPPNRWWHQHFNAGATPARYIALHAPTGMPTGAASFTSSAGERLTNREEDQIEYPDEDPWIRQHFEAELAKRGVTSKMPEQAYRDRKFEWAYSE